MRELITRGSLACAKAPVNHQPGEVSLAIPRGKGATDCDTPKTIAEASEIIITIVSDSPDVEAILFGENGAAEGLGEGQMVIDMSTISPVATRGFAEKLAAIGCSYLDAPVSGGEIGAKNATLTIMVGGSDEDFARGKPLSELPHSPSSPSGLSRGSKHVSKRQAYRKKNQSKNI